jgi:DNA-binding protein H-NS
MTKLKDLLAQREAIEKQIADLRQTEIAEYGLTQSVIFGSSSKIRKVKDAGSKVAPKYRDPISGKEWSGRGLAPKWLQGKDKADYLIA